MVNRLATRVSISAFLCAAVPFCLALSAQTTDLPPDVLFLSRSTRHISQAIASFSNYTCTETIDREQKKPAANSFQRIDLVRLEVAKTGAKELFAWPGAARFEDRPITDFVGGGLIGNGVYSLFAEDIFVNHAASMKVFGPEQLRGRPAVRVDYTVHPMKSAFTITTAAGSAVVNYSGSYWVDPNTLDLLRLDIAAEEIPAQLGLSSIGMSIEYGTRMSRNRPVVMALSSVIEMAHFSGDISRDDIEFTNCREFSGDANLIFGSEETVNSSEGHPIAGKTFVLPGDLTIALRLEKPIDGRTASVGDAIEARVENDVRDRHRVWLPKGVLVHGRIRRLEYRAQQSSYVLAGLEFSEAEVGNDRAEFIAQLESIQPSAAVEMDHAERKTSIRVNRPYGAGSGGTQQTTIVEAFDRELAGVGYLYLTSEPFRLPEGFRTVWKTSNLRIRIGSDPRGHS